VYVRIIISFDKKTVEESIDNSGIIEKSIFGTEQTLSKSHQLKQQ
jgi:hypothetical protein